MPKDTTTVTPVIHVRNDSVQGASVTVSHQTNNSSTHVGASVGANGSSVFGSYSKDITPNTSVQIGGSASTSGYTQATVGISGKF
ncbi:MAG: hypothetical protein ACD_46C00071G0006 [uncultured bacterium]|nr:MAG: hypothetical protein ACD_46C00071G0006 [uncultured bacterium]